MNKLLLISATLLLFGCKKYKVSDLEQNYLCEITQSSNISGNNSTTNYDLVLAMEVEDKSIVFNGYEFPLKSFDRRTGSGTHTLNNGSGKITTLTLSDGFTMVSFIETKPISTYYNSGSATTTISGVCTTLSTSNPFDAQEGNYDLFIQELDVSNGIDTAYSGTFAVSYNEYSPNALNSAELTVDGASHILPSFYSHYDRTRSYQTTHYFTDNTEIYWSNDNIYYSDFTILEPGQVTGLDTTELHHYEGAMQ